MKHSNLCGANVALGQEVHDFLINVPDVKEESVTDFLIWRWRQLDRRFNYLSTKTFTRHEEHRSTGADFELKLWLVGRKRSIPILFQAKKFTKPHDSYVRRFNYPSNTQRQLSTLLKYAATESLLPFYAIYSPNSAGAKPLCRGGLAQRNGGIYMLSATDAKAFGDAKFGKRLALQTVLEHCNPFHCIFCCPFARTHQYFRSYFGVEMDGIERSSEQLPLYVKQLLAQGLQEGSGFDVWPEECSRVKAVAVYDLREEV